MVGLVLVSHSASLAEGAAELARQMGGEDVPIEPAGGLDLPDRPIGTDAVVVLGAIDRAWSEDGVLVLMDLGSAILSAEMAFDMLPDDRRERVRLTAAPFVEGAVAAAVASRLGRTLDEVVEEASGGLAAKSAHLGEPVAAAPGAGTVPETGGATGVSIRLPVRNRLGLHARPAARLVATAGGFEADVHVANVTTGRGPASARSLNAVATLGVLQGHEIEVVASGSQAREALEAIAALAADDFGDEPEGAAAPSAPPPGARPAREGTFVGLPASPGIAVGAVRHIRRENVAVPDEPSGSPAAELEAFDRARETAAHEIRRTRAAVAAQGGAQAAAIFDAHLLLLEDETLVGPVRSAVGAGTSAARAWQQAIDEAAARWRELESDYLRARADDVEEVGRAVLAHLVGVADRPTIDGEGIVVAVDLTPGETAQLDRGLVRGVATARGAPTSHAAVLARSLGIPAVVALGEDLLALDEGTPVIVDGDAGALDARPDAAALARAQEAIRARSENEARARAEASTEAVTADGVRIEVAANVGRPEDVAAAVENGADGVGLLRTEFLFLGRAEMPSEDEQEAAYRAVADGMRGRPVTLRTLDVGGDKPLPYVPMPAEANPFLGLRGLRLALARPELLRTQLRAALRVATDHDLRVMFPMVTTVEEFDAARALVDEAAASVGLSADALHVGVMVEVPATAIAADAFAPRVAFFSIGTNDLAQYTLAAERGNDRVASLADALHPAVLRAIASTTEAASAHGVPVAVCGELAADLTAVPLLIGLGVTELSVAPPAIPAVKRAVRATTLADARDLAVRALAASSAAEVRTLAAPG